MRTIREAGRGTLTLRLVETGTGYSGVVLGGPAGRLLIEGDDPDDVWRRLEQKAAMSSTSYFGFDGARARFLHFFPEGFAAQPYAKREREYKDKARQTLLRVAPLEEALQANALGAAVMQVFRNTNLIEPRFELRRVEDLLRSHSADAFIRAAARVAQTSATTGLAEMAEPGKPFQCAKWTVLTYLPFLWRPETHMFLKPEATKDFAARVGHSFAHNYTPSLEFPVYRELLDLAEQTEREIVDLRPCDRIDVQGFIWVVGKYTDADMKA